MKRTAHLFNSNFLKHIFLLFVVSSFLAGCATIEVYEKNAPIPKKGWDYNLQPTFEFTIKDTSVLYNLYVVLRHTDAYGYNNIWLNIGTQSPGDSIKHQRFDLQIGTDAAGWEGTAMDDIWELRKSITRGPFKFNKAGNYKFNIAQVMRENPLPEILSAGIRVEQVK